MSDPVQDFEYARNAATFTYDLTGVEHVRLRFEALEFGDEPHAPPAGPFGDDVNFDGVAISLDGVSWYEIQGLRGLRSDRYTAFDLDLDVLVVAAGLAYNGAFRIRFCQYDDNPAPMDGVSIKGIELVGDGFPPILHLTLDDNAASPVVVDSAAGHHDQAFVDPGGDPNTSAHSVPGRVGTALAFDGVDDQISISTTLDAVLAAGHDFSIAFWWTREAGNTQSYMFIFQKPAANGSLSAVNGFSAGSGTPYTLFYVYRSTSPQDRTWFQHTPAGYGWNHYVLQRRGNTFELWANGALVLADSTAGHDRDFSGTAGFVLGGTGV
ncbi:MAG: hypothetical protein RBU21_05365, partial [FCB group bacterium]|nr:hypothetical protein [FCB group bacterium]